MNLSIKKIRINYNFYKLFNFRVRIYKWEKKLPS